MTNKAGNVLDLLRAEDLELRRLFEEVQRTGHDSIQERAAYGDLVKQVVRHTANREAALRELGRAIDDAPEFRRLRVELALSGPLRRSVLDQVEKMSRGIQGINLNTGQDFDGPFQELVQLVGSEIESDLEDAVPALEAWLRQQDSSDELPSATCVLKHAPTNVDALAPKWYERAPIVSRLLTVYDHLRDFPKAARQR